MYFGWSGRSKLACLLCIAVCTYPRVGAQTLFKNWVPIKHELANAFDDSISTRHNWCDTATKVAQGELNLALALEGFNVSAIAFDHGSTMDVISNGTHVVSGFTTQVLDEIARRGKFTFRESMYVAPPPSTEFGDTWTEVLLWGIDRFDIVLTYYMATSERRAAGAGFHYPLFDSSLILVAYKNTDEPSLSERFFSFLKPFTIGVWLLLLAALCLSAFVYAFLESNLSLGGKQAIEGRKTIHGQVAESLWLSFAFYTKVGGPNCFKPKTNSGRIFILMYAWAIMLLASAYTANLTQVLIVESKDTFLVEDIETALRLRLPVCVQSGTAYYETLQSVYPMLPVVTRGSIPDLYQALRDGECVAVVQAYSEWQQYEGSSSNSDCMLEYVGRPFFPSGAGFVSKSDSGANCTNLLRDVVAFHLQGMIHEKWVEEHIAEYLQTQTCNENQTSISAKQLDAADLGGIFLLMFAATLLCSMIRVSYVVGYRHISSDIQFSADDEFLPSLREVPTVSTPEHKSPSVGDTEQLDALLKILGNNRTLINQLAEAANSVHRVRRDSQKDTKDDGCTLHFSGSSLNAK